MAEQKLLHPAVLWAQRKDIIFLTISLEDANDPDIQLENNKMTFRSKGGHDQENYGFEFTFFNEIIPEESKKRLTKRQLAFVLKKKEEGPFWPRLLSSSDKVTFLKTDFDKWKDEEDSEEEEEDVNQNFEDMMKKMGDASEKESEANAADSEDSDDEDMPGLE